MQQDDINFANLYSRIQQRLAEFFHELDIKLGRDIGRFYLEDGVLVVAGRVHEGREAITAFYAARNQRILLEQKDGVRTARHLSSNLRVVDFDSQRAEIQFVLVYFSGEGKPPLFGMTTPTVVADCQMDFRRESDGVWRIAKFTSQPQFVGDDPFMRKAVVPENPAP